MPTLDTSLLVDLIRHDPEAMRTLAGGSILARLYHWHL